MSFYGYTPIPNDYSYVARAGEGFGKAAGAVASGVAEGVSARKVKSQINDEAIRFAEALKDGGIVEDDTKAILAANQHIYWNPGLSAADNAKLFAVQREKAYKYLDGEKTKRAQNAALTSTLDTWGAGRPMIASVASDEDRKNMAAMGAADSAFQSALSRHRPYSLPEASPPQGAEGASGEMRPSEQFINGAGSLSGRLASDFNDLSESPAPVKSTLDGKPLLGNRPLTYAEMQAAYNRHFPNMSKDGAAALQKQIDAERGAAEKKDLANISQVGQTTRKENLFRHQENAAKAAFERELEKMGVKQKNDVAKMGIKFGYDTTLEGIRAGNRAANNVARGQSGLNAISHQEQLIHKYNTELSQLGALLESGDENKSISINGVTYTNANPKVIEERWGEIAFAKFGAENILRESVDNYNATKGGDKPYVSTYLTEEATAPRQKPVGDPLSAARKYYGGLSKKQQYNVINTVKKRVGGGEWKRLSPEQQEEKVLQAVKRTLK